jgi:hypothetical protein
VVKFRIHGGLVLFFVGEIFHASFKLVLPDVMGRDRTLIGEPFDHPWQPDVHMLGFE